LEREIAFSDTVLKRIELADEYMRIHNYAKAAPLYESCLEGIFKNDTQLLMKLIRVNYQIQDFQKVIEHGNEITDDGYFKNSDEKAAFAWSYHEVGDNEKANAIFQELDVRFSNYKQRFE
jgi:hypothetical protein